MSNNPDYIQFYPTLRCNKSCDFCFNKGIPSLSDMPLERFHEMLVILKAAGVRTIDIMGGEPTLHPDIEAMIRHAEDAGFLINFSSNGTDLSLLERIIRNGRRTTVGISVNDRQELSSVKDFVERHRPVVKTIFRQGLDLALVDNILSLGPKKFFFLFPDAMHVSVLDRSMSFDRFLADVRQRWGNGSVGLVYCSGFLPDTANHPALTHVRCPAGTTKLGVMPDGSVYPCNLLFGREGLRLGNILSDPFETIRGHPRLGFFRTFTGNTCPRASCKIHLLCHGGCPAHGLAHRNDLSAPDPRCF